MTRSSAGPAGSYVLIVHVPSCMTMETGGLGEVSFAAGYYAYVGSALGGIKPRLRRHASKKKTARWHVDYLTNAAPIKSVFIFESLDRLECRIAEALGRRFASVPGFGCGDCDCSSHLFFAPSAEEMHAGVVAAIAGLEHEATCLGPKDIPRYLDLRRG